MVNRSLRWYDYIIINLNWFALTSRSNVLTPLIVPLLVQQFVGEEIKGTYLGRMRLWALMIAILTQAITGILSDRSTFRFGKRRPFIFIGTIVEVAFIVLISTTAGYEGMKGYWILFILYIFSMFGGNINHAATQGLIPDLIPDDKKGIASGIKAVFEIPLPLVFVSMVIANLVAAGNLSEALTLLIFVLVICMTITMFIPEKPRSDPPPMWSWTPFLRPIIMTCIFAIIILGIGKIVNLILSSITFHPKITNFVFIGVIGVLGISLAVLLGVWSGLRIGIGIEIKENPSYLWWVVNRLLFLTGVTNLGSFLIFFVQEKFSTLKLEQAAGPASRLILYVGIFVLLTALFSGWLADTFGKKNLIIISGLLTVFGAGVIIISPILSMTYMGGSIIGIGVGLFYTANWALGTEIVPKERAGQFLGFSNLAGAGAGAIGAYIGGPIADFTSYTLLMAISGCLALLSILPLIKIKDSR